MANNRKRKAFVPLPWLELNSEDEWEPSAVPSDICMIHHAGAPDQGDDDVPAQGESPAPELHFSPPQEEVHIPQQSVQSVPNFINESVVSMSTDEYDTDGGFSQRNLLQDNGSPSVNSDNSPQQNQNLSVPAQDQDNDDTTAQDEPNDDTPVQDEPNDDHELDQDEDDDNDNEVFI